MILVLVLSGLCFGQVLKADEISEKALITQHDYIVQRQADERSQALIARATELVGQKGGQCVVFARQFSGVGRDKVQGLAKNTKTNSTQPELGSIIKLNMSRPGHVAVVIAITAESVTFVESNVPMGSERVGIRTLQTSDSRILGYLIP